MAGGIPLDWLINITSVGVKDIFSLAKLPTLVISKANPNNPRPKFSQFTNLSGVYDKYGSNAKLYSFASNYFGFTSKMATKADLLNIYTWYSQNTAALVRGVKGANLEALKNMQGGFSTKIKNYTTGEIETQNFAFTNDEFKNATSMAEIATIIQQTFNLNNDLHIEYNEFLGAFVLSSGTLGSEAYIDYLNKPTENSINDISELLGLTLNSGAELIDGYNGVNDLQGVLNDIELENGAYYNITTDFELDSELSDLEKIGAWVKNSNSRYLFTYISQNKALINTDTYAKDLKTYDGLNLEFRVDENQDGYSSGIISAINFSRTNGNYNVAFNSGNLFDSKALTLEKELNNLEANNANSYLKFGKLGQFQTWYGLGNVMGEMTKSLNVYIANSFLVANEQFQLANMFNSQPMIGLRGKNNVAIIKSYLDSVFEAAINSAIIVQGVELTTTERNSMITAFGDDGQTAIRLLQEQGYFYKIDSVDLVNKTINIIQAYVANTPIKRVIIANYILGA